MMFIEGTVEDIIFRNEENGYTVARLVTSDGPVTFVGKTYFIKKEQFVELEGEWIYHDKFGEQFQFTNIKEKLPSTINGIESYLASGLIPHIGKATARKIVDKFKENSLDIIQYYPERLLEVDGIGKKKLDKIMEAFEEQREIRQIIVELKEFDISTNQILKIYKQYGSESTNIIKENPYRLTEDIRGIGFKISDDIANKVGVDKNSPHRIKAGLKYIMNEAIGQGHTFLPEKLLIDEAQKLLTVSKDKIVDEIKSLLISDVFVKSKIDDKDIIYHYLYNIFENNIARKIIELSNYKLDDINIDIQKEINEIQEKSNIKFANKQREAIVSSINNGVLILTGGPGTGKTTIIKAIIEIFKKEGKTFVLAAPTGRAAKRIKEYTGYEAKTLHRLLEISYGGDEFNFLRDEENPIESDIIIVDEASMIDISMMNNLINAIKPGSRLILVGDVDQLPSVGAGNILRDIINSNVIKVVRLDEIFRQEEKSMIIVNAHRINNGLMPILNEKDKDFFFIYKQNPKEALEEIKELVVNRLPKYYGFDPINDIQVLSPMKKGDLGVISLNQKLQAVLNPENKLKPQKSLGSFSFRVGDKVMQIKNNYQIEWSISKQGEIEKGEGIYNGDIGIITEISDEENKIKVLFDQEKEVEYDYKDLDQLTLSYAITIHKSQGSEFRAVIIPVTSGPKMLLTRNLIYTGVTRAKDLVILVGDKKYIYEMVRNNQIEKRYSALDMKIKQYDMYIRKEGINFD
ncbi:MAG: ATP-dependent RecD-like DNA helicase [Tissierellales bacterium]|nr:ATP-dependent RecD-like DNA helicase [Tissierellales bacterium]